MASMISGSKKRLRFNTKPDDSVSERISERKKTTFADGTKVQDELVGALLQRRQYLANLNTEECESKMIEIQEFIETNKGKRWLVRTIKDKVDELSKLKKERQEILDGLPLKQFDAEMRPVMRRLKSAAMKRSPQPIADAEREVRKRLTLPTDAISLQRAIVGDMCDDCGISMHIIASDSLLGCPQCAKTRIIPIVSTPVADSEFVAIPYAQKSRLVEWLEFCQAKEYAEPAVDIIEIIMSELVSQKATGLEEYAGLIAKERQHGPFLNVTDALNRLKNSIPKLKEKLLIIKAPLIRQAMQTASFKHQDDRLRKYYERSPKYAAFISGYWPLRFSSSQEERIRSLYAAAVPAYEKYRKPSQPNWPGGYAYFLRSLCVLLGWDEFVEHFNLKSGQKHIAERESMRQRIWSRDLDWEYIPCEPTPISLPVKRKRI